MRHLFRNYQPYKYNIHYLLNQLNVNDYEIALEFLPELCECKWGAFKRWIYLKEGDSASIPSDAIVKMAVFFEVDPLEMYNTPPDKSDIAQKYLDYRTKHFPQIEGSQKFA